MKSRNNWITARSQIAFVVGFVIAVAIIFWLESAEFGRADDPAGTDWIVAVDLPGPRMVDAGGPGWLGDAVATVAAGDDATATVVAAAACRDEPVCAPLADELPMALGVVAMSPRPWGDSPAGALTLTALAALLSTGTAPDALPAWRSAVAAAAALDAADLPSHAGLRQFAARSAALSGRDFAAALRFLELSAIFDSADGLVRLGLPAAADLALGLGLLADWFPDDEAARQLLWRTYDEWPYPLDETPTPVLALWWSQFDEDRTEALIAERMAAATPLDAAVAIVAAEAALRGALLAPAD